LEIGAGTGKFTEQLIDALNNDKTYQGYKYRAVEPHREMAEVLEAKSLKSLEVLSTAKAEDMKEVGEQWADGVVVATVSSVFKYVACLAVTSTTQ
jgi:SAM-dependent MidA family methyltransferase